MPISNNSSDNERNKFIQSDEVANQPAVVVVNPDGTSIGDNSEDTLGLTATRSSINDVATSSTVLAANTARKGASFVNASTSLLYLKYGITATATTGHDVQIGSNEYFELPEYNGQVYKGRIDGIWSADASGSVNIVEYT